MAFDVSRLRRGEQLAALGAILLLVFLFFLDWYGVGGAAGELAESVGVDASVNGWDAHEVLRYLVLLASVAGLGLAFLTATQRTVALPVTAAVIATALAALTTLLLAYRVLLNEPGPNELISVEIGAYLGLLSAALLTYAGYLAMRDEGTSLDDARNQARAAGAQARAAFDSSAPRADEGASAPPPPSPPPAAAAPPSSTPPASEPPTSEPPASAPPPASSY